VTDSARVSDEQMLAEWTPTGTGRVSDEQLIAEWTPTGTGRVSDEQMLAEWAPNGAARLIDQQLLAEWTPPGAARLIDLQLLVEWQTPVAASLIGTGSLAAAAWATLVAGAALSGAGALSAHMGATLVLRGASSDLDFGGLFDRLLAEGTETAGSITVALAASQTGAGYAFTPADFPGLQGAAGDYTVKVNVTTGNNRIFISVLVARVDATGVTQASSGLSAEQTANAGVKTFAFAGLDLGAWRAGDRLMAQFRFRNSQNMSNTTAIETGTANATVTTPWSAPQGKARLPGAGSLSASAAVIAPTNAAASAAAQTSVSGTADKTFSRTASYAPDGSLDWDVEFVP